MSQVLWNEPGIKEFETGVDRGVLYLPDSAVPWVGLTGVDETSTDVVVTPYYFDGVPYYNQRSLSNFTAKLKAFTYPRVFEQFEGYAELESGFLIGDQPVLNLFGLSYRTLVGNDLEGQDFGYRIHMLYNLTANPDDRSYSAISASPDISNFGWTLSGVPVALPGYRPTCHFVLDTRRMRPAWIRVLESMLYGTETTEPALPNPAELLELFENVITEPLTEPV